MATDLTGDSDALLALAREFRHAISARQAMVQKALYTYDHAAGHRFDHAAKFLQAVQRADCAYESSSEEALGCFRESIEER